MLRSVLLTTLLLAFSLSYLHAQDSWKKLSSNAEQLFEEGKFAEAGDSYFKAWKLKPKKTELANKAGDCFFIIKDYAKAAKAYKPVKDMNDTYHQVGLKYARSLKSLEQYDEASREFVYFINSYKGDDYTNVSQLVQNEILGCELGIKNAGVEGADIPIQHLSDNINSPKMEYAPLPYTDDILYFSSDVDGNSKIYRSQKLEGEWTQSKSTEKIFSNVSRDHYGNVSFAPDNSRFYFTQCDATNSYISKCDIYVVESKPNGKWSDPIILPDYVNDETATSTHPNVVHVDGIEIIYFASDREGGKGGMDLWYISREINSKSLDFTFPKNLGSKVNTVGNEITPFYDEASETLYFSSDGQIGYGGFDIFSTKGSKFDWERPKNLEKPFNSSADDRYYIYQKNAEHGFFISNRSHDLSKLGTTDEDIFEFGVGSMSIEDELVVSGKILDGEGKSLSGVDVALYELDDDDKRKLITQQTLDGSYTFPLMEEKKYVVEADKKGHNMFMLELLISEGTGSINKDLVLAKESSSETIVSSQPVVPSPPTTTPSEPEIKEPEVDMIELPTFEEEEPSPSVTTEVVETVIEEPEVISTPEPVVERPVVELPDAVSTSSTTTSPVVTTPSTSTTSSTVVSTPSVSSEPSTTIHTTPSTNTINTPAVTTTPVTTYPEVSNPTTYAPEPYKPTTSTSTTHTPSDINVTGHITFDPSPYETGSNSTASSSSSSSSYDSGSSSEGGSRHHLNNVSSDAGIYYKVQMEAMKYFRKSKYTEMEDIGGIETEYISSKDLVRIMLGNYYNKEDAVAARDEVRARGYDRAYVVKYVDGKRKGIKVFYND